MNFRRVFLALFIAILLVINMPVGIIAANAAENEEISYDYKITTDETISLQYSAKKKFSFVLSDTSIARITSTSTSSIQLGSMIEVSSSIKIVPLKPGYVEVTAVDTSGIVLARTWLLIEEGSHKMQFSELLQEVSCTEPGKELYTCKYCGYQEERIIPNYGHIYNNDCDSECNVCQTSRTVEPHVYDNNCDINCNICGEIRDITHDFSEATCTEPETCRICGITAGNELGHVYTNECDDTCNRCDETRTVSGHIYDNECDTTCNECEAIREITHNYAEATCTNPKTCTICGTTSGSKLEHDYYAGYYTSADAHWNQCERCGEKKDYSSHIYSNKCDTSCNICNTARKITHTYKTVTTKATLTKNGSIVKKCSICGNVQSNTVIKYPKTFKLSATSYTYDGKVKTPSVTVKDSAGKTLKKNTDYTVTYASGRKNVGTYKVTIKMKGNYSGTKTLTFKINKPKATVFKLSATAYTYDGKVKTPGVTVKDSAGKTLKKNTDYTVTYASGRKNVGTYKVTIKMKGKYSGTKTLIFKINPPKTTVSKLTPGKKNITVAITKKSSQVTGYQIQYSTSKKFTNAKTTTVSSYKTTKYTLKSLSAKKTYYVRVRTYKKAGSTTYYSGWSNYKYTKTK